jgi:hypothetical protein
MKSSINEDDINNDIMTELPKRSIIELSKSDMRSKKKVEDLQKKLIEKDKYIKDLESIIIKERKENLRLKKSENACILKISALEDELRIFKNKFMNFRAQTEINSGYAYGEKLIKNIRDNILENQSNNNINEYNNNMTFNNTKSIKISNRNSFYKNKFEAPWLSQSYKNININNNKFSNMNMDNNGAQNNFQRVSEMILDNNLNNNNKITINKKYNIYTNNNGNGNNFNGFRYGNGNNYNNNF